MKQQQRVKICGIRDAASARVVADEGADYLGFVFYEGSHRYVSPACAREISATIREEYSGAVPETVGLFVNVPLDELLAIAIDVDLDLIQLSGDESAVYMTQLARAGKRFIATVRATTESNGRSEQRAAEIMKSGAVGIHLDSHVPGMWGGTGVTGDWSAGQSLARSFPTILAGGLDESNVASAVSIVRPCVVDVSSGVETQKQKDHGKIRSFIRAARRTESRQS